MVRVLTPKGEILFPESEWQLRVSRGDVPPDALVFSLEVTGGRWKRAAELPFYDFFRRIGEEERREAGKEAAGRVLFEGLIELALPKRGLSLTEVLTGLNLLVAAILMLAWKGAYTEQIFAFSARMHRWLAENWNPAGLLITLFLHADVGHLTANMATLFPASAFIEYLYGRKMLLIYFASGLAGAIASFALKGRPPLSVGASGAIYGLMGAFAGFVLRHVRRMASLQRWKARRIYVPLIVLATLPSLFHADWRAHVAGLLSGLACGILLPVHKRAMAVMLDRSR